jgi:hypothetical protein
MFGVIVVCLNQLKFPKCQLDGRLDGEEFLMLFEQLLFHCLERIDSHFVGFFFVFLLLFILQISTFPVELLMACSIFFFLGSLLEPKSQFSLFLEFPLLQFVVLHVLF